MARKMLRGSDNHNEYDNEIKKHQVYSINYLNDHDDDHDNDERNGNDDGNLTQGLTNTSHSGAPCPSEKKLFRYVGTLAPCPKWVKLGLGIFLPTARLNHTILEAA